ncbi:hypothetical protein ACQKMW_17465 [Pseudomonas sivasensis]
MDSIPMQVMLVRLEAKVDVVAVEVVEEVADVMEVVAAALMG